MENEYKQLTTAAEEVYLLVGEASMTWGTPQPNNVFDSNDATRIGDRLVAIMNEHALAFGEFLRNSNYVKKDHLWKSAYPDGNGDYGIKTTREFHDDFIDYLGSVTESHKKYCL